MLNHSSAKEYEETRHVNKSTKNKTLNLNGAAKATKSKALNLNGTAKATRGKTRNFEGTSKTTISNALKRRAQSLIKDRSIDYQSRALIRYGLETNDPWLPELVRRADAGETIIDTDGLLANPRALRG